MKDIRREGAKEEFGLEMLLRCIKKNWHQIPKVQHCGVHAAGGGHRGHLPGLSGGGSATLSGDASSVMLVVAGGIIHILHEFC